MRSTWLILSIVAAVLSGCGDKDGVLPWTGDTGHAPSTEHDQDDDGYMDDEDCDDNDAAVSPGAIEVCDGVDNDCDGAIDDADEGIDPDELEQYFADADADGYGDPDAMVEACDQPPGYVDNNEDCDDGDATFSPDAAEICDRIDNDCDGDIDDDDSDVDVSTGNEYWEDNDNDSYGNPNEATVMACAMPAGYADNDGDCNDSARGINPGATEVCDAANADEDCNGYADDEDPKLDPGSMLLWNADTDGDGYTIDDQAVSCDQPPGYAEPSIQEDCNDDDADINPDATEICDDDNVDEDCDTLVNEDDSDLDTSTMSDWYEDCDSDGYGDADGVGSASCQAPTTGCDYVADDNSDCDDDDEDINPDATEICDVDDNDEDCNGSADDDDSGVDTSTYNTWYADSDGDGYGDESSTTDTCDVPSGYVQAPDPGDPYDCDDSDADVYPGAEDTWYDGTDSNCDGNSDYDADADGEDSSDYGGTDCDDTDADINTSAEEICDDIDNNCNGDIDDDDASATGLTTWYADADSDGYPDADNYTESCEQPDGYIEEPSSGDWDCDDSDADINPDADEICNEGVDDDCDGDADSADDDLVDGTTYYDDVDGDGYGDENSTGGSYCEEPSGAVEDNTDCDDSNDEINPDAEEVLNALDDNCNGYTDRADPDVHGSFDDDNCFTDEVAFFEDGTYSKATCVTSGSGSCSLSLETDPYDGSYALKVENTGGSGNWYDVCVLVEMDEIAAGETVAASHQIKASWSNKSIYIVMTEAGETDIKNGGIVDKALCTVTSDYDACETDNYTATADITPANAYCLGDRGGEYILIDNGSAQVLP